MGKGNWKAKGLIWNSVKDTEALGWAGVARGNHQSNRAVWEQLAFSQLSPEYWEG